MPKKKPFCQQIFYKEEVIKLVLVLVTFMLMTVAKKKLIKMMKIMKMVKMMKIIKMVRMVRMVKIVGMVKMIKMMKMMKMMKIKETLYKFYIFDISSSSRKNLCCQYLIQKVRSMLFIQSLLIFFTLNCINIDFLE